MCHKPRGLCPRERLSGFLLCSSRPVVDVVTELSFSPEEIPVHEVECSNSASEEQKHGVKLKACFRIRSLTPQFQGRFCRAPRSAAHKPSNGEGLPPFISCLPPCPGRLLANLSYTLQLDGHRTRSRGLFPGGSHELNGNTSVTLDKSCLDFHFHFPVRRRAGVLGKAVCSEKQRGCSSVTKQL